jgi:hypothetical protein
MKVAVVMQSNVKPYVINLDIYAVWYKSPPAYRIYIDDELMTERTFLGTEYEFYRERIAVNLEPGVHSFVFERLPTASVEDRLSFKNFLIDNQPAKLDNNQFTVTE